METAILVTVAIFMAGITFHAGKLAARTEALEAWRIDVREEFRRVHADTKEVLDLLSRSTLRREPRTEAHDDGSV
jgi:hypothetical protein